MANVLAIARSEAIQMLPSLDQPKLGQYAQIRAQKSGTDSLKESRPGTTAHSDMPSQIVPFEQVWRKLTLMDTVAHKQIIGCLARTRT
jgi:hypothetical protein